MDPFLNIFFLVFHTGFILFVLFGWVWPKARKVHLAALALTALSWFGFGITRGFGYCFCTDWHWNVLYRLGHPDLPRSYITFLIQTLTGCRLNDGLVDAVTVAAFFGVSALAVWLAVRERRRHAQTVTGASRG